MLWLLLWYQRSATYLKVDLHYEQHKFSHILNLISPSITLMPIPSRDFPISLACQSLAANGWCYPYQTALHYEMAWKFSPSFSAAPLGHHLNCWLAPVHLGSRIQSNPSFLCPSLSLPYSHSTTKRRVLLLECTYEITGTRKTVLLVPPFSFNRARKTLTGWPLKTYFEVTCWPLIFLQPN